jgi:hypothetical protein
MLAVALALPLDTSPCCTVQPHWIRFPNANARMVARLQHSSDSPALAGRFLRHLAEEDYGFHQQEIFGVGNMAKQAIALGLWLVLSGAAPAIAQRETDPATAPEPTTQSGSGSITAPMPIWPQTIRLANGTSKCATTPIRVTALSTRSIQATSAGFVSDRAICVGWSEAALPLVRPLPGCGAQ